MKGHSNGSLKILKGSSLRWDTDPQEGESDFSHFLRVVILMCESVLENERSAVGAGAGSLVVPPSNQAAMTGCAPATCPQGPCHRSGCRLIESNLAKAPNVEQL